MWGDPRSTSIFPGGSHNDRSGVARMIVSADGSGAISAAVCAVLRGSSCHWPLSAVPGYGPMDGQPAVYLYIATLEVNVLICRWSRGDGRVGCQRKTARATVLYWLRSPRSLRQGRTTCTTTTTPRHPFEPSGKRRRGFPLASPASSRAIASSAPAPSSWKNLAGTTCARAVRAAAFRRCCRRTGRFDGVQANYYVRDK